MDLILLSGLVAAGVAAGIGTGAGLHLLPAISRWQRELRQYETSPEIQREQALMRRDQRRQLVAYPEGQLRETSIIGLDGNTIRHQDGSYSRLYEIELQQTTLAADYLAEQVCNNLSRLLCLPVPANTVFQFRYAVTPDPGAVIARHLQARANHTYLPAVSLHDSRLEHYHALAQAGAFRRERALLMVRIPISLLSDQYTTLANTLVPELFRAVGRHGWSGITDAVSAAYHRSRGDGVLRRLAAEEKAAAKEADKYFRLIELHGQDFLKALDREETWQALFTNHCLERDHVPQLPPIRGLDLARYLVGEDLKDKGWYTLHGSTPVTMLSMFVPPNPVIYADTLRAVIANPELTFRHTLITEFVKLDKAGAKKALQRRIRQVEIARDGFKVSERRGGGDHDANKALADLNHVLYGIAGTNEDLVNARMYAVVYGQPTANRNDLQKGLEQLEENGEKLIRAMQLMDGAEVARENPAALHCLYERSMIGESDHTPTGREFLEVASSLAALIPRERAFQGSPRAHTVIATASGRLIGIDLFDKRLLRSPIVLFLGAPGSGKTTLVAMFLNDALASVPDLQVSALDNGGSLAPWAEVIGARYLRLSPTDDRTFNIYDYPGLRAGEKPDESDIALVVLDATMLAGYPLDDRDTADLITNAARVMLERKADLNATADSDDEKVEPTLRDLVFQLENYPNKHQGLKDRAARIASRLRKYVGNQWLDAPTHPEFRHDTRCDIYELQSLDGFSDDVKRSLANRMAARVLRANAVRRADGTKTPSIQAFVEVWKLVADYPDLLKVIRQGGRTGRRDNVITLLDTHDYDELKDIRDIAATAGMKFLGPQNKNFDNLIKDAQLNERAIHAINAIHNIDGIYTQWLMVAGVGQHQQVEMLQAYLSPVEFWTWANNPYEFNARQRVLALKPRWTMTQAVQWLAEQYPRGLTAEGLVSIDERLLA
ncbi:MAG TPA: hypothetical protein VJ302_19590 [Blastocatellia bacterium]|nr:hypothetical protein [Blastocatellia bacterium]